MDSTNGAKRQSPKLPFAIAMKDGRPFSFAGLWEGWKDPESGEWRRTCTIITGEPNELVAQIHPRMPVILPEKHHAAWLGKIENGNLKELLVPYPADQMRMWVRLKQPTPHFVGPLYLNPRPPSALLRLRPFSVGRFALLRSRQKNMSQHIFQSSSELQNIPEAAPKASPSFSVCERLARYGSSALSGVEHLRLLVGRDSAADTLLRHFGSLKELHRASFQELRQFLTRREAEAVIAGLSMWVWS